MDLRALDPIQDLGWAETLLQECLGGRVQARMEQLIDVLSFPGFVAEVDGKPVALLTYREEGESIELAAICSRVPGAGRVLIDAMKKRFPSKPLWLVTTNDNRRALRTYRRQGFVLEEVRTNAVTRARRLKPTIPKLGQDGIPINDELILRYEPSAVPGAKNRNDSP